MVGLKSKIVQFQRWKFNFELTFIAEDSPESKLIDVYCNPVFSNASQYERYQEKKLYYDEFCERLVDRIRKYGSKYLQGNWDEYKPDEQDWEDDF